MLEYIKQKYKQIALKRKLRAMDMEAAYNGSLSWMLFPPSYYYTHTEEEIKRDTERELAKLRQILKEFEENEGQQKAACIGNQK